MNMIAEKVKLKKQKQAQTNCKKVIASFDLQKVLTTPHSDSTLIGCYRKYVA